MLTTKTAQVSKDLKYCKIWMNEPVHYYKHNYLIFRQIDKLITSYLRPRTLKKQSKAKLSLASEIVYL